MAPCKGCGGEKPKGKGRKYCDDCAIHCPLILRGLIRYLENPADVLAGNKQEED